MCRATTFVRRFPHNYVQASFQPLPGMHELQQRIRIKKVRAVRYGCTFICNHARDLLVCVFYKESQAVVSKRNQGMP